MIIPDDAARSFAMTYRELLDLWIAEKEKTQAVYLVNLRGRGRDRYSYEDYTKWKHEYQRQVNKFNAALTEFIAEMNDNVL